MKIALVCDWLTNVGGAERVIKSIHDLYPDAPIYTSQYNPKKIDWFKDVDVRTGWLQIFPSGLRRFLAPLRQIYFNHLDLSEYDVIISITGAEAKSVKKGNAKHFCFCHVPTQYYWQLYDDYVKNPGFGVLNPLVRFFFKLFVKPLRKADYKAAQKPDYYITISSYAQDMIKKYYHRDSVIIPPPVNIEKFLSKKTTPRSGFIITARQVSWKRHDLAIKACLKTNSDLTIIGEGPENANLHKLAAGSDHIHFYDLMTQDELKSHLHSSSAFIFPSIEPFGIAPVEALAAGCPVIALKQGAAPDFITEGKNGVFFKHQTVASLVRAIKKFKKLKFDEQTVVKTSLDYSEKHFKERIKKYVKENS